ncbi:MAG: guanylate kinase [Acidocella sp.]|nr:guanylate kinase [Acidocella sp.]
MNNRRGLCLVLAAPSGAGKTTLSRALLASDPGLSLSISVTTRGPRTGEVDGQHYHFISQDQFAQMAAAGELLEHASVFGRSYGTPRAPVEAALAAGKDILFDIDWQGFRQLRAALPDDVVGVFIMPPSLPVLTARLTARGDSPEAVNSRMAYAEAEMAHASEFDFQVENAEFDKALEEIRSILNVSRAARARQPQ